MGYPLEFRNNVVRSILSDGTRISDAAKEYQVARVTIYSWLKVARQDAAAVSASNIGTQNPYLSECLSRSTKQSWRQKWGTLWNSAIT